MVGLISCAGGLRRELEAIETSLMELLNASTITRVHHDVGGPAFFGPSHDWEPLSDGVTVNKTVTVKTVGPQQNFQKTLHWLDESNDDDRIIRPFATMMVMHRGVLLPARMYVFIALTHSCRILGRDVRPCALAIYELFA